MKKITAGNPLLNLGLVEDYKDYQSCKTSKEITSFFHRMIEDHENRPFVMKWIWGMMSYTVDVDINQKIKELI